MKKLLPYLCIVLLTFANIELYAQTTTVEVGADRDYTTLQAAFQAVQSGTLTGIIEMNIISDITETGSSVIVESGSFSANYSSITVIPSGGHRTISYDGTFPLVYIDGATNVTFDGRIGGTGDVVSLTLENSSGNIFDISNNASDITIHYCNLKGSGTNQDDGVIRFTVGGNFGCDNVVIDNCNIGDESYTPANGIYVYHDTGSAGEDGRASDITISNCNIFNFWNPAGPSAGIKGNVRVSGWTVTGNNLYQTAERTSTASNMHYGIYLGEGDGHIIEKNYIGGSAPGCGGTAWTVSGNYANKFSGIHISSGTTIPASVQGNTIANFSHQYHSTTNAVSLPGIWTGIHLAGGDALIGTETGNTIGSGTGTGSITVNSTGTASVTSYGIGLSTSGKAEVSNNTVGSFTLDQFYSDQGHNFTGIEIASGNEVIVEENLIGSENTENSIYVENDNINTTNEQISKGISSASTGNVTIKGNTVSGIMNNGYWLGRVAGIDCTGGTYLIEGNVVKNLASLGASYGTEFGYPANSIKGIAVSGTSGDQQIIRNTIHTLEGKLDLENINDEVWATGIFFMENSGDGHTISQNNIYGIDLLSEDGRGLGVFLKNSDVLLKNNAIRLGHGISNNQTSVGILSDGNNYIIGNSVYITGNVESSNYQSYAYFKYQGTDTVMNNVFYNARRGPETGDEDHVAIGRWNYPNAVLISDYNNLYADGREGVTKLSEDPFGTGWGTAMSFENWQSGEEQDLNSLSVDPLFAGADEIVPDIHITETSPMRDAGTAHPLLITDIDGDLRGEVPDIGCDEYFTSSGYVGEEGYATLKEVFDAINKGELTGDISVVLGSGTTETETAVIYPSGYDSGVGISDYTSVSIGAVDQSITVAGNFEGSLVRFDGAHNVDIGNLTFENSNASGFIIEFANSASNNRVANSILKSSVQVPFKGVVTFSGAGAGSGNNNNIIEFCEIVHSGVTMPFAGIVSAGTEGSENSGNTISNNNILNFWSDATPSGGISIDVNNTGWIIEGNSLYQEQPIAAEGGNDHYGIYLASTKGHTVSGNYIGGSAPGCEGTAWTVTGPYPNIFTGIHIEGDNTGESTISGNTISNFSWQSAPVQDIWGVPGVWTGIRYEGGSITISDNTIGSGTGNNSILIETTSEFHAVSFGIAGGNTNTDIITINGNTIGSIDVSSVNTDFSHSFVGIQNYEAGTLEISGNLIGSTETPGSITTSTQCMSAGTGQYLAGIVNGGSSPTALIKDNSVINLVNLTLGSDGSVQPHKIAGIVIDSGSSQVVTNTISNLSTSSQSVAEDLGESATGILMMSEDSGQEITGNTIFNISNTSAGSGYYVSGIAYKGLVAGTNIMNTNRIYGLTVSSSAGSVIRGISIYGGEVTCFNNMVSLGSGVDGGHEIYGIYKNTLNKGEFYHNSVVVTGPATVTSDMNTAAFMHDQSATDDVLKNNIFYNTRQTTSGTGKNYAFYKNNTGSLTLDYNNYRTDGTGTALGYDGTGDVTLLPLISVQDGNSINEEVTFTDITTADLHTNTAAVNGEADPSVGVIVDFDGDTRNPEYPDIGADEFILSVIKDPGANLDFGLTDVLYPTSAQSYEIIAFDLTENMVVTAPEHFQVSLESEDNFSQSVSVTPVSTNLETTIYARFLPDKEGSHFGHITNVSSGQEKTVNVQGSAHTVPPLVQTSGISDPAVESVTANANISHTGGRNVTRRGIIYWPYDGIDKEIGVVGVVNIEETGSFAAGEFSMLIEGLNTNARYNYRAHGYNGDGDFGGTGYGDTEEFWTLARIPGEPVISNITGSSVDIDLNTNMNPVHTEFAIYETTTNRFVQSDGTMTTSPAWHTDQDWGTVTVALYENNNRTGNREYTFSVKARSGGNTETGYGVGKTILTSANTPNIMWVGNFTQSTVDISVYTSGGDYSNNTAGTLYKVRENNSGWFAQSDGTLGAEAAWKTRDDWYNFTVTGLAIGTEYSFSSIARNDDLIETDPGPEIITYTLAAIPDAPVVSNITDTSADIGVDPAGNPANVEMAIMADRSDYYDNYYVQTDGSLGSLNSAAVWKTAAEWEGLVVQGMTPNVIMSFSVKARNGNNTETGHGEVTEITTLATTPNPPNVEVYSNTDQLYFTVDGSGNSASTEFVVQDEISGDYVQADGYLGNVPVWMGSNEWLVATQYIRGLTPATSYSIRAKARNSDGIETEWGLPTVRVTNAFVPGVPSLSDPTSGSVDLEIDPNNNPSNVTFAIQEQSSSKYVQTDGSLGGTEVWRSVADWGVITVTGLNPDQELTFRVKARNTDEAETSFSGTSAIRTLAKIPVAPSVEVISSSTINIAVQEDGNPGSVRYAIIETTTGQYVGYNGEFSENPVWFDLQWYATVDLRYLIPETEYSFRVIARNSDEVETLPGPAASGTTPPAPPAAPTQAAPANYATNQEVSLTLSWNAVEKADSYGVQVSASSWFGDEEYIVFDERGLEITSVDVGNLIYGYTYFWRVNAANAEGEGEWSGSWSFTTKAGPPPAPELITPSNGAENVQTTLHLNWNDTHEAETYMIQVSTDSDFSSLLVDDYINNNVWWELSDLDGLTTYYWRVKASNSHGESPWSEAWSFTTMFGVPAAPVLSSPANNSENQPTTLQFSWQPVEYAESYSIQVGFESDMSTFYYSDTELDLTTITFDGLTENTVYYWWVNATNEAGTGEWSEIWSFTTGDPTGIVGPGDSGNVSCQIFPNPANDIIYISGIEIFPVRVQIISDSGQLLIDKYIDEGIINVQHLATGLYLINIEQTNGEMVTRRIVISR